MRFEILPYLKKKAAAYSTDKKAWFDNLERWGYFFFLMYVVGLFHLWWTENLIQGFEISRQTKHTILLMLTGRFLSCLVFCIFAFLLLVEYFEYLIELQIFAGIVVGMFVVILCCSKFFFTIYKSQQANVQVCIVRYFRQIQSTCLIFCRKSFAEGETSNEIWKGKTFTIVFVLLRWWDFSKMLNLSTSLLRNKRILVNLIL